jgi:hypothetical protein
VRPRLEKVPCSARPPRGIGLPASFLSLVGQLKPRRQEVEVCAPVTACVVLGCAPWRPGLLGQRQQVLCRCLAASLAAREGVREGERECGPIARDGMHIDGRCTRSKLHSPLHSTHLGVYPQAVCLPRQAIEHEQPRIPGSAKSQTGVSFLMDSGAAAKRPLVFLELSIAGVRSSRAWAATTRMSSNVGLPAFACICKRSSALVDPSPRDTPGCGAVNSRERTRNRRVCIAALPPAPHPRNPKP